jgi:hypothetical protein
MPSNNLGKYDGFGFYPSAEAKRALEKMALMEVTPEMKLALSAATAPAATALKMAARGLPSQGKYSRGGLRSDLAKGVKRLIASARRSVTATFRVTGSGGAPLANLGRAVEGEIPWTHPVFGNPGTEVTQQPKPFFYRTLNAIIPGLDRAFKMALEIYERKL